MGQFFIRTGAMHPLLEIDGCKCTLCTRAAAAPATPITPYRHLYYCVTNAFIKGLRCCTCLHELLAD